MIGDCDRDSYTLIFAWIGLMYQLKVSKREDFDEDLETIRGMITRIYIAAKAYTGSNSQIKHGFEQVLESVPTLLLVCPDLMDRIQKL